MHYTQFKIYKIANWIRNFHYCMQLLFRNNVDTHTSQWWNIHNVRHRNKTARLCTILPNTKKIYNGIFFGSLGIFPDEFARTAFAQENYKLRVRASGRRSSGRETRKITK